MRSFVGFVVFVGVLVGLLVLVVVPVVGRPLIAALARDALPFDDESVRVTVDVGSSLLGGEVDTVTIGGRDLRTGDTAIGVLDLTVRGYGIFDRTFRDSEGRLEDVMLRAEDGTAVSVAQVELRGPSDAVAATATLDANATEGLIRAKLAERGIVPERVRLADGRIEVTVQGLTAGAALEVRDDGLYLVPDALLPAIAVIEHEEPGAWRITASTVSPDGIVIEATVNAEAMLAG